MNNAFVDKIVTYYGSPFNKLISFYNRFTRATAGC